MTNRTFTMILLLLLTPHVFANRFAAQSQTAAAQAGSAVERAVTPDAEIEVRNPFGSIIITGWNRDTVRAEVPGGAARIAFSTTPAKVLVLSVMPGRGGSRAGLSVSLPRGAASLAAEAADGRVTVTNVDGSVTISTRGDVNAEAIGGDLVARTTDGEVNVSRVRGLVDLSVVSGGVTVRDAGGDVRVASINGGVRIACVEGRADVANVNGSILLANVGGDVEATTSNSSVELTGAIRPAGRYRLKSHNGTIEMRLPLDSIGFTATLSSYGGGMETDFPLAVQSPFSARRLIGRYREGGDGRTSIQLDSFGGGVRLIKLNSAAQSDCRR